ncbi:MAG: ABC transporter substrate-binding protein, partial [Streptosporangiaceae bacterium]
MRFAKLTGTVLSAVVMAALAACSGTPGTAGVASGTAARQLNIAVDLSDLTTLDPERALADAMQLILPMEGDTLLDVNPKDPTQLRPSLATSWSCNSAATACTITLRHGVKFSTGRTLTSADVVYTFERMVNVQGGPAFLLDTLKSARALGPGKVEFQLKQPDSAFLSKLAAAGLIILDSNALAAHGGNDGPHAKTMDKANSYFSSVSIGTGPYKLKQWVRTQKLVFVPNPDYWGAKPAFAQITLLDVPKASTQAQLIRGGEADLALNIDPVTAKTLQGTPDVSVQTVPSLNLIMLCLDNAAPGLGNVKVRRAIAETINYDSIVKGLGGGAQRPPATVPVGLQGASAATPAGTKMAAAKALVRQDGVAHLKIRATFANKVQASIPL